MRRAITLLLWLSILLLSFSHPALAQTQEWVAYTGMDGNLYLIHPDGSGQRQITFDGHITLSGGTAEPQDNLDYEELRWSPDGQKLAMKRSHMWVENSAIQWTRSLMFYDMSTGTFKELGGSEVGSYDWKPDSSGIVYGVFHDLNVGDPNNPPTGIWQLNISDGEESELVQPEKISLTSPSYSRDGRYLAFRGVVANADGLGPFGYWDFSNNTRHFFTGPNDPPVGAFDWLPDGSFLIYDHNKFMPAPDERVYKSDLQFKQTVVLSPKGQGACYNPLVSYAGSMVAFFCVPSGSIYGGLWVSGIDGMGAKEIHKLPVNIAYLTWSADGSRLGFATQEYAKNEIDIAGLDGSLSKLADGITLAWQPVAYEGYLGLVEKEPTAPPSPKLTGVSQPAAPAPTVQAAQPAVNPAANAQQNNPAQAQAARGGLSRTVFLAGGAAFLILLTLTVALLLFRKR